MMHGNLLFLRRARGAANAGEQHDCSVLIQAVFRITGRPATKSVRQRKVAPHKPGCNGKLRFFIFAWEPQPSELPVFIQLRTGEPGSRKEARFREAASWSGLQERTDRTGGIMTNLKKLALGAAMVAGTLGMSAAPAQAARVGVFVGGRVAYVPPCPGPGYAWVAGYWNDGVWVPGYWNYIGVHVGVPVVRGGVAFGRGPVYYRHFGPYGFRR
jgi:hypothetical protein